MVKVSYYKDEDVLTIYLEDLGEDHFEDKGNVTILYRDNKPIGFEVWQASKLLTVAASTSKRPSRLKR